MNVDVNVNIEFNRQQVLRAARRAAIWWLTASGKLIGNTCRELLSVEGSGRIRGRKVGPIVHSSPGEAPYKQTGNLRASINDNEIDRENLQNDVGTPLEYGAILELGLGKLRGQARPFLRRSLGLTRSRIESMAKTIEDRINQET